MITCGNRREMNFTKEENEAIAEELVEELREEENGSIICRELLAGVPKTDGANPESRTPEYYKKRPCVELVGDSAEILDEYITNHPVK